MVNQISDEDICHERAERVEGSLFDSCEGILSCLPRPCRGGVRDEEPLCARD